MSIRSIAALAVRRDLTPSTSTMAIAPVAPAPPAPASSPDAPGGPPPAPVSDPARGPSPGPPPAGQPSQPAPAGQAEPAEQARKAVDTLAEAIPTEVIVLYTTVLGVLAGTLDAATDGDYLPLRWLLYLGCMVGTAGAILVAYYAARRAERAHPTDPAGRTARTGTENNMRRFPLLELAVAVFAFAVWGLIVPESAIYVVLEPPVLPVTVTVLSAVGVFVLTALMSPWLNTGAKPAINGGDSGSGTNGSGPEPPAAPPAPG